MANFPGNRGRRLAAVTAVAFVLSLPVKAGALADDPADGPALVTVGAGYYDINRRNDVSTEFRLEYRSDEKLFDYVKPFGAVAGTTDKSIFVGAGVLMDFPVSENFILTPSFAPHYYHKGSDSKKDLGHKIEFRSQLEFAYLFDDLSRLGLSISHYSNARLGSKNPGTETLMLNYSVPATRIADWLE